MTGYSPDLKTPLARLAFCQNLFKPRKAENSDKLSYQATLLFPKSTDLTELKNAAATAALDAWGDKAKGMIASGLIKTPFLDGDGPQGVNKKTGERYVGFAGQTFIRISAVRQPKLFSKKLLPATEDEDLYPGCYVYAVVNAYTWEHPTNGKGVSIGFSMMQAAKDGERLGRGEPDPNSFFEKIADEGDAPEETKSGAGAAGLFA